MGIVWALVVLIVGVTAVLSHAKNTGKRLQLRQAKADFERAKFNEELEKRHDAKAQADLDADLKRREREHELEKAEATKAEDIELTKAEKLEKAALKRQAAAEADAKAKVAALNIEFQVAADREVIKARAEARKAVAEQWAASEPPPQPFRDPIESVDLNKLYKEYMSYAYRQSLQVMSFGKWLGENYRYAVKGGTTTA